MKVITKIGVSLFLLNVPMAFAEPVTVPHAFTPNTPAKASEVNSNLQALATAINNLKHVKLYQNNVKVGSSVLINLVKLDSGYLVLADKKKASANIYVAKALDTLVYTTNNCTGTAYTGRTLEEDIGSGEIGVIAGYRDTAYYMNTTLPPVNNLYANSVKDENGICHDISQYGSEVPASECTTDAYILQALSASTIRANVITYSSASYNWYMNQDNDADGFIKVCQTYTDQDLWWGYAAFRNYYSNATPEVGTPLPDIDYHVGRMLSDAVGITGRLERAYAVIPNNPSVTGVTTAACIDNKGRPAVCLPNAQLVSE